MSDQHLNIDAKKLTSRASILVKEEYPRFLVQLSVSGRKALLTASFMEISRSMDVDISFQEDNMFRRNRRLVCFDMDSTLIQTEVIDELAEMVWGTSTAITEAAMNGESDFKESLRNGFFRRFKRRGIADSGWKNLPITKERIA
jgi:phosphoserine phosphatase